MGWHERKLLMDHCQTHVEFNFADGLPSAIEDAAFCVILSCVFRVQHGYEFFNKQTLYSRETKSHSEERQLVYDYVQALQTQLIDLDVGPADARSVVDAQICFPNGRFHGDDLKVNSELCHPLDEDDLWRLLPVREAAGVIAEMFRCPPGESDAESGVAGVAGALGRLMEAVGWQVSYPDRHLLIVQGLPPSIDLMLNQHIYPWIFSAGDEMEDLALLMDEALLAGLASFYQRGTVRIRGAAWHKHGAYNEFELRWQFEEQNSTKRLVRMFRRGRKPRGNCGETEWHDWKIADDPRFGYFTLTVNDLSYDEPDADVIAEHRTSKSWETL